MGFFKNLFSKPEGTRMKLVTENGNGFYTWDGKVYRNDIVRSCIRPKAQAVGKCVGKHLYERYVDGKKITEVNPDAYMRFLLEEPNPYMSGQMLQEKLVSQLLLNGNAFAAIIRDENGLPSEIFPISASAAEAIYDKDGKLFLKFYANNGKQLTLPYEDVIHLRRDFNENDIFGQSPFHSLSPLLEVVGATDHGIVNAIKNSGIIRFLLKFTTQLRPEDLTANAKRFAEDFLSSDSTGVAATDAKADVERIEPKDYVPNAVLVDRTVKRIYSFFGVNENIVQGKFSENDWISFYESEIEPLVVQLSQEYTRKLFTRRERAFGNRVFFESANLQFASLSTKLQLQAMVDRGAMTPNEWREAFGMSPVEGGDRPIRRLDTAVVEGGD